MRLFIGDLLGKMAFEVRFASDGREALACIGLDPPDLVLVDWKMPVMNGLEFVRAVRADDRLRDVPIMMVTSETSMATVAEALAAGANEYVMKPFTFEVLREKLALMGFE
jgi:two-component system chemotaxis response regulator CheY